MNRLYEPWKFQLPDYPCGPNPVHVWRSRFQDGRLNEEKSLEILSKDEIEKVKRFVRQTDRDRYVAAHIVLRRVLSKYIGCDPQELIFKKNRFGKPFLVQRRGNSIQFNMSHSHDMVLLAIARGTAVGVDVEYIREIPDALEIAEQYFLAEERNFISSFPPQQLIDAFFACWTLKEAFIKGLGLGLSYPLNNFSTICLDRKLVNTTSPFCNSTGMHGWKIFRLSIEPGYSGALAVRGAIGETGFFEY